MKELRNIDNILKHLENEGKDCSKLNLRQFSVGDILDTWGERFLRELTTIKRDDTQILRGNKRKNRTKPVGESKTKKKKYDGSDSLPPSSYNGARKGMDHTAEEVLENFKSLGIGKNIVEEMS